MQLIKAVPFLILVLGAAQPPEELFAQRRPQAVGLVVSGEGRLVRNRLSGPVKPGELLFPGDELVSTESVGFLFCPDRIMGELSSGAVARFMSSNLEVRGGELRNRSEVASCYLPVAQRLAVNSQQRLGAMVNRGPAVAAQKTSFEQRKAALPQDVRAALERDIASADATLRENPKDGQAHLGRAVLLERAGLLYDAHLAYQQVATVWADAAWVKRKLIDLENAIMKSEERK